MVTAQNEGDGSDSWFAALHSQTEAGESWEPRSSEHRDATQGTIVEETLWICIYGIRGKIKGSLIAVLLGL